MLGLLLLILKILGIILAALLGLILILALAILLVPVRYRGRGSYYHKPEGWIRITWLLHLICVQISYPEKPELVIRIFGFRAFKEKGDEAGEADEDWAESPVLSAQEVPEELADPKLEEEVKAQEQPETEEQPETAKRLEPAGLPEQPETGEQPEPAELPEQPESAGPQERPSGGPDSTRKPRKKKNLFLRLTDRLRERIRRLQLSIGILSNRIRILWLQKEQLMAFIHDEKNKKTFRLVKKQLKLLIRHVRPGKLKGSLTFGLEDPYLMGQILSGAALFYPLYHKSLKLTPVFEQQMIEGELFLKGRVRPGTLLFIGLRLLIHKNFRVLLKRFLNQGGK